MLIKEKPTRNQAEQNTEQIEMNNTSLNVKKNVTNNSPWARCLKLGARVTLRGTSRDIIFLKRIPLGNIGRGDTLSEVVPFRKY